MRAIFKLNIDCGRYGNVTGIFVAEQEEVKRLIDSGVTVYFGEALGKHSDVHCKMDENRITEVTADPKVVEIFDEHGLSSGYNPFDYVEEDDIAQAMQNHGENKYE